MKPTTAKTKNDILEQLYISAEDLMVLIPELKYGRALQYINDARREMEEKKCFVPVSRTKVALTKFIRKRFGF